MKKKISSLEDCIRKQQARREGTNGGGVQGVWVWGLGRWDLGLWGVEFRVLGSGFGNVVWQKIVFKVHGLEYW